MADSLLDREKLVNWLLAHAPSSKLSPKLVVHPAARHIADEYPILLEFSQGGTASPFELHKGVSVRSLFPPDDRQFSTVELSRLLKSGEIHEHFVGHVRQRVALLHLRLAWDTGDPAALDMTRIRKREHLGEICCRIKVEATMPPKLKPSVYYTNHPYAATTIHAVKLNLVLDEGMLTDAGRECWPEGKINFGEFLGAP